MMSQKREDVGKNAIPTFCFLSKKFPPASRKKFAASVPPDPQNIILLKNSFAGQQWTHRGHRGHEK
jgi:hypothetical protein